jgi:hypothetical protein
VIDVRDDAEIARQFDCHESRTMLGGGCSVNRTPFVISSPTGISLDMTGNSSVT